MSQNAPISLTDKVVLVTGASRGIGAAIAKMCSRAGARVVLASRKQEGLDAIAAEIKGAGGEAVAIACHTGKPEQIKALFAGAVEAFGKVDVLVNNAGIQHVEAVETFPIAKWDAIIAINLSAAFHAIRAVVPEMKARKWGRIINVASAHALVASPYKSAYVAAKHGVLGLTKTVALETAEHGITVNAICPGYVLTPLVQKQIPETAKARNLTEEQVIRDVLLHAQPTRKFVTTEEIGALAVFLCTGGGASITGAALPIEGGWTAQ
jgi:3-hydroxybutyrate dehydrogenase